MVVNMGGWLVANWKALAVIVPLTLSSGYSVIKYTEDVDARFDTVEQGVAKRVIEVDNQLDRIEDDVADIRCMSITHAQGGDPLDCIKDR